MRRVVAGAFVGLVVGALGMWLVGRGREAHDGPAAVRTGETAASRDAAEEGRKRAEAALEAARKEIASLKESVSELQRQVVEARRAPPGLPEPLGAANSREKWKKVAATMWKLREQMKNGGGDGSPEDQEMGTELITLLAQLAKELGVTMNEAIFAPEGFPSLLLALLEAAGVSPEAAQAAGFDAAMTASRSAWTEYLASREKLSRLEQQRALMEVQEQAIAAIRGALSPAQASALGETGLFDSALSLGDSDQHFGGTRESVAASLSDAWSRSLSLDASQKAALGPVVGEFMREYDLLNADNKGTERERAAAQLDLTIRAQKRIRETLRLSPEQEKSLGDWSVKYGYSLSEGDGPK
ncbi:MAG: hypothetical protein FD180_4312 [Planctomycetota bacterium]|nr:MAG: hypothetical protein FD180_4312 [Planctomycetota bacterium]